MKKIFVNISLILAITFGGLYLMQPTPVYASFCNGTCADCCPSCDGGENPCCGIQKAGCPECPIIPCLRSSNI